MRVTVLGCGGSSGVPLLGGNWGTCDPAEPRNRRRRPAILVEEADTAILVDTGPDLREQLIAADRATIDAVLYTHAHADHVHGLDDLREVNRVMGRAVDVYADATTLGEIQRRFGYAFPPLGTGSTVYRPVLAPHVIDGPFAVGGVRIVPFEQDHGFSTSLGFRFGAFAYSTDVVRLAEPAFEALDGIDTWIVDCVREAPPHPVHAHVEVTLGWIARVRPRRAYLTHMGPTMDYQSVKQHLPPGVEPAYDGLVIEMPSGRTIAGRMETSAAP